MATSKRRPLAELPAEGFAQMVRVVLTSPSVLGMIKNQDRLKAAKAILDYMNLLGVRPTQLSNDILIDAFAATATPESVDQLHDRLVRAGFDSNIAATAALRARAASRKAPQIKTHEWMERIVDAARRFSHDISVIVSTVNEARKDGTPIDSKTLDILLHEQQQGNHAEMLIAIFQAFSASGVTPSEVAYSIVTKQLCSVGRLSECRQLIDELRQRRGSLPVDLATQDVEVAIVLGDIGAAWAAYARFCKDFPRRFLNQFTARKLAELTGPIHGRESYSAFISLLSAHKVDQDKAHVDMMIGFLRLRDLRSALFLDRQNKTGADRMSVRRRRMFLFAAMGTRDMDIAKSALRIYARSTKHIGVKVAATLIANAVNHSNPLQLDEVVRSVCLLVCPPDRRLALDRAALEVQSRYPEAAERLRAFPVDTID